MTPSQWYEVWRTARERHYDAMVNDEDPAVRQREQRRFWRCCDHMARASLACLGAAKRNPDDYLRRMARAYQETAESRGARIRELEALLPRIRKVLESVASLDGYGWDGFGRLPSAIQEAKALLEVLRCMTVTPPSTTSLGPA